MLSDEHSEDFAAKPEEVIQDEMDRLAETVDMALTAYDENNDGYIYYGEFYRYVYPLLIKYCSILAC